MRKNKLSLLEMSKMKEKGEKLSWITAYDYPFAQAAEKAGVDMILVGDSGGMVQLGYKTTNPVSMDEMISFCSAVRRGAPNTFIVGDMPQGSYEIGVESAVKNAIRFVKESGCDAIKLEGGRRVADKIEAIVKAGIPVIGHLGLTPQSSTSFGGYRVQGKTAKSYDNTLSDCKVLQEVGVSAILLEAMPNLTAAAISRKVGIPIYGIGAGTDLDGQLIIMHDLMGFYQSFRPWFAKCYIPEVLEDFMNHLKEHEDLRSFGREHREDGFLYLGYLAVKKYIQDVKQGVFPGKAYSYPLKKSEEEEIRKNSTHGL